MISGKSGQSFVAFPVCRTGRGRCRLGALNFTYDEMADENVFARCGEYPTFNDASHVESQHNGAAAVSTSIQMRVSPKMGGIWRAGVLRINGLVLVLYFVHHLSTLSAFERPNALHAW